MGSCGALLFASHNDNYATFTWISLGLREDLFRGAVVNAVQVIEVIPSTVPFALGFDPLAALLVPAKQVKKTCGQEDMRMQMLPWQQPLTS